MRPLIPALAALLLFPTLAAHAQQAPPKMMYTTTELRVRAEPNTRSAVILTLPEGAQVPVTGCSNGWCEAVNAAGKGYLSQKYLTERPPAETIVVRDVAGGPMNQNDLTPFVLELFGVSRKLRPAVEDLTALSFQLSQNGITPDDRYAVELMSITYTYALASGNMAALLQMYVMTPQGEVERQILAQVIAEMPSTENVLLRIAGLAESTGNSTLRAWAERLHQTIAGVAPYMNQLRVRFPVEAAAPPQAGPNP